MNHPLLLHSLLARGEKVFPKKEIVSRTASGIFRYTYADYAKRTRKLSTALVKLGVQKGDCIGTFAWNHHRHLEAYFAIPCIGSILHTINIRLFPAQLVYIIQNAQDKVLMIDEEFIPLMESIADRLDSVKAYIIMSGKKELPQTSLHPAYAYESLIEHSEPMAEYPNDIDENAPMGMCYTSATTGNPKGVIYSHRAIVLHSYALGLADTVGLSETDVQMPIVPMFHVNAWGLPFASVWFGTKQVLPGPAPTPEILVDLMEQEQVSLAAGVPTVWLGVSKVIEQRPRNLKLRAVLCGGSAAPKSLIQTYETKFNIPFLHAYGMTETAPLVTVSRLKSTDMNLSEEEILQIRSTQGLLVPGLDMRVVSENGEVAWDGKEMGELLLRGPWIADSYFKDERSKDTFRDGWLHTGDVAVVDAEGRIKLVDRTKDLIKSGGEWISSVDLENALMAHPSVFEAAVVSIPHPKWDERPLAFVTLRDAEKHPATKEELLDFLRGQFAKWWLPDDILFVAEIPRNAVGKFLKRKLREEYNEHFKLA